MGRPRLFGTDGIRAPFGRFPLDRPTVTALGRSLVDLLRQESADPEVVIGGDTRDSTPILSRWLADGIAAAGGTARYLGIIPTPGVAYLVRHLGAQAGIAVSASHNPHPDNGIKLIDAAGLKWHPDAERLLETRLLPRRRESLPAASTRIGEDRGSRDAYLASLGASLGGPKPLEGLRIAVDAANGAAAALAAGVFADRGAQVDVLFADPNGTNINSGCGSTHPEALAGTVRRGEFHLGVALDGDADRALLVDERGAVRDGDAMLFLWATALQAAGSLGPPRVVATAMSNLGLVSALAARGIEVVRCDVGDRAVVQTMRHEGALLGGEQSGHLVCSALSTTGDGLLTSLQLAAIVRDAGRPLSELLRPFQRYPQILLNVPVAHKPAFSSLPRVVAQVRTIENELGDDGRLLLRYSGTEPLARIMVEGRELEGIQQQAESLAETLRRELG
jgi:phosphoglucosamine mutase